MKTLVLFSGGLDSTVLLRSFLNEREIIGLHFDYGQKHFRREYDCAKDIFTAFNLDLKDLIAIKLPFINEHFRSALLQSGEEIPNGSYNKEEMSKTVVPFRNGIMISIAVGYAQSVSCYTVALANHSGDHFIYPDCTPAFIGNMFSAVSIGTSRKVLLLSPFLHKTKAEIVKLGVEMKVPFNLTYSCYKGGMTHCGVCGTCLERRRAFKEANVIDSTTYNEIIEI